MASKAAVQMYTLRDFTKTRADFDTTLGKVAEIGYQAVQLSGIGCMNGADPEVDAATARTMLDNHGLTCIATHRSWESFLNNLDGEIAFHQALGCSYAAIGSLGPYRNDGEAGYRRLIEETRPVLPKLKEAGITWGYHNHEFEFQRIGPGQRTLYDLFIEEGGDLFALEIDTYWAVHAGINPIRLIQRCAGRVPVIHVKDKEVVDRETVFAPIGEGNLDWDGILPACREAGVEWYAVEQDRCRRDPFDCLRSSFEFLTSKGV